MFPKFFFRNRSTALFIGFLSIATIAMTKHRASPTKTNFDDLSSNYISCMSDFKLMRENYCVILPGHTNLPTMEFHTRVKALQNRISWNLRLYQLLNKIIFISWNDEIYRLEWMHVQLRTLRYHLERLTSDKTTMVSFDNQCVEVYDTIVPKSYLDPAVSQSLHNQLHLLIDPLSTTSTSNSLFEVYQSYRSAYLIPTSDYEAVFRVLICDVMKLLINKVPELSTTLVHQEYISDPKMCFEVCCICIIYIDLNWYVNP